MAQRDKLERLEDALLEFVERAAKSTATPVEVEALPRVAAVLVEISKTQSCKRF